MRLKPIRLVVTLALVILMAPLATAAQQPPKVLRIGLLFPGSPGPSPAIDAFRQGLREHGYVEGQNILLEYRFADGQLDPLPHLAAELVRLHVDLIVAAGPAIDAAKSATRTIPIVMAGTLDAVAKGYVQSLAQPGGNITGLTRMSTDVVGKRLQLLKETLPHLSRLAVVIGPSNPGIALLLKETEVAAQSLGVTLQILEVRNPDDIPPAFAAMTTERAEALSVTETLRLGSTQIIDLAAQHRLPTFFGSRESVDRGGFMSLGPNIPDMYRRAATYVDKILKGAKPADLPVEQPIKFEFVLNLKTAQALGFTIPPMVLFQADEVIK